VAKDGYLYASVGDGGCNWENETNCNATNDAARSLHALVGKIVRITRNGEIPAENPFQGPGTVRCNGGSSTSPNKCREIFATGLRNPFRIAFDPNASSARFFINDVGQNTWEEIDEGIAGADYGWNVREGPCVNGSTTDCGPPPPGMTNPIFWYRQGDPSGCRAVTGGAFVPAGLWPSEFSAAYLYADYVCGKIFRLSPQPGGGFLRTEFASALGSNSAVHMTFGPYNGSQALYYTTYAGGGSVRRIEYTGGTNRQPVAAISASPTFGPAPLDVDFDGSDSSDPDAGDTLTYEWDFGDGQTASGSSPTIRHTYSTPGTYDAILRVRDNHGALSGPATVQIQPGNTPPVPTIETPAAGATFRVGQNVVLHGSATDPQEGSLPSSSLRWEVLRHHGTSHTHPWLPDTAGNDIPISTPGPEDLATTSTSFLEVRLTATDSHGLAATVTRQFRPTLVDLTFATDPSGLELELNGEQVTAPFTFSSWRDWAFPVTARPQESGGSNWRFDHWSDGGAATHVVTTGASPATYTATFRANAPPTAAGSSVSTPEDSAQTVTLNGSDPDADPLTFAIQSGPSAGTLGPINGNTVVYTPNPNANGADSFTFRASDGGLQSNVATATIAVLPVNDPPTARADVLRAETDGPLAVDVLANDSPGPADESGQTLAVTAAGAPAHGTAVVSGGRILYTPARDYNGADTFSYTACDDGLSAGIPDPRCSVGSVDFAFSALPAPANVTRPRIVGGRRAGTLAVADAGEWSAAPLSTEFGWSRCGRSGCTGIIGATGSRYLVRLGDVGLRLRVQVTVRNRFGGTSATSSPTRPVASPVEIAAVRHRRREWVLLRNQTRRKFSLDGWTLADGDGHVRRLGRVSIGPLDTLRIRTRALWAARDRVVLLLPGGRIADTCQYRARRAAVVRC
jgi:Glucose / Sorbosone dehydrogenase/Bacterial Ig domain/PKD domain